MTNTITILQTNALPDRDACALQKLFNVVRLPAEPAEQTDFLQEVGPRVRAIAGTGKGKVSAKLMDSLPNLEFISIYSAGLDSIDTQAAAQRGIPIANTSAVLSDDVADLALWLLIGVSRRLVAADRFVRQQQWQAGPFPQGRAISGTKVGILGLGHIGKALARRLEPMGGDIGYCGRRKQADIAYRYYASLTELAQWCDALIVCCPATTETENIVNKKVLNDLGPQGILINISRGSVVDESALVDALRDNVIGGAGLDVFANEPNVPARLLTDERVIVLPHLGSATVQTREAMGDSMLNALTKHFSREI